MAELAHRTTGYVGADLSALCREAAMQALRENSKVIAENINSPFSVAAQELESEPLPVNFRRSKDTLWLSCLFFTRLKKQSFTQKGKLEMPFHLLCVVHSVGGSHTFSVAACRLHMERSYFELNQFILAVKQQCESLQ